LQLPDDPTPVNPTRIYQADGLNPDDTEDLDAAMQQASDEAEREVAESASDVAEEAADALAEGVYADAPDEPPSADVIGQPAVPAWPQPPAEGTATSPERAGAGSSFLWAVALLLLAAGAGAAYVYRDALQALLNR
jgi:hypothetical protein